MGKPLHKTKIRVSDCVVFVDFRVVTVRLGNFCWRSTLFVSAFSYCWRSNNPKNDFRFANVRLTLVYSPSPFAILITGEAVPDAKRPTE